MQQELNMVKCAVCKMTYIPDVSTCPHCAEARAYIARNRLLDIGREKLVRELDTLSKKFRADVGYSAPPVFITAVYRMYHMPKGDA